MKLPRLVKYPLYALLTLLALFIVAAIVISQTFDPNQFKPELQTQVKKATGLELNIDGELDWQLFPSLAIRIGSTQLHTSKSYDQDTLFASLDGFEIGVGWGGLLSGSIMADRLNIDGLALRLVTDASGHSNWNDIQSDADTVTDTAATADGPAAATAAVGVELNTLALNNISVSLIDLSTSTRQALIIESMTARQLNIAGKPFPLRTLINFDSEGSERISVQFDSNIVVDLNNSVYGFENIAGKLDKSNFNGSASLKLGDVTSVDAELAVDQINIDQYLSDSTTSDNATSDTSQGSSGGEELPLDILKALNTSIQFSVDKMIVNNAELSNVTFASRIDNGVLNVDQLHADVFHGAIDLELTLDSNKQPASLSIDQRLAGIEAASALASQEIAVNLSGKARLHSKLAMRGNNVDRWVETLSGNTSFAFEQGRYADDNIEKRVCQAIALVRKEPLGSDWSEGTAFKTIDANIDWSNGVGKLSSFRAGLDNLDLQGEGSISLLDSQYDLRVGATVTGDISDKDPGCAINEKYRDIAWPLRCRGDANDSGCGVDNSRLDKLIARIAKEEAKSKIREKIDEKLGKGVGDALRGLFR